VTEAVRLVVTPFAGTFLVSSGESVLVRCGGTVDPIPRTEYVVLIVSLDWVARAQEYGIVSLHVFVVPVAVADSSKIRALVVMASITTTSAVHSILVMPADLTVMVRVTVTVPPNVAKGAESVPSSAARGTGRNAPVCGSRYPRMPC
jgi:hypothetical protein